MSSLTKSIFEAGNTAVITGASSGIGRATSLYCASVGMHVWMVDIDKDELDAAQNLVQSKTTSETQKITARVVNVADATAMESLAKEVFANENCSCQFLMNNAGIDGGGRGAMQSMDLVEKVVSVNTFGPMHGCLAFLPRIKKQPNKKALIVNTGSKQGITMPPGNLTYNMSKAALKVYTEGLEHELYTERSQGLHEIHAALLVPGWVNTSIVLKQMLSQGKKLEDVYFHEDKPAEGAWMPSQVVDFMLEELDKGRFYIICPDNDVTRQVDNVRMTWTMQDVVQNRPPLSRWHEDYTGKFQEFLESSLKQEDGN